jgi:hypothetical protein
MSVDSGTTSEIASEITWRRIPRWLSVVFAGALAGCVPHSTDLQSQSDPNRATPASVRSDARLCRPDPALLMPPLAPDCSFKRAASKAMDPDEFTRLKVEYELHCYQNAERRVRQRLRLLQVANKCQIASAR